MLTIGILYIYIHNNNLHIIIYIYICSSSKNYVGFPVSQTGFIARSYQHLGATVFWKIVFDRAPGFSITTLATDWKAPLTPGTRVEAHAYSLVVFGISMVWMFPRSFPKRWMRWMRWVTSSPVHKDSTARIWRKSLKPSPVASTGEPFFQRLLVALPWPAPHKAGLIDPPQLWV